MGVVLVDIISNQRQANVTMNNPESSRDHVIVCMKMVHAADDKVSLMYIGDLAGFENEMKGDLLDHVLKFDIQYQGSGLYNKAALPRTRGPYGPATEAANVFGTDDTVLSRIPVGLLQDVCDYKTPVGAFLYNKSQVISDTLTQRISDIAAIYDLTMRLDYRMYITSNLIFKAIRSTLAVQPTQPA